MNDDNGALFVSDLRMPSSLNSWEFSHPMPETNFLHSLTSHSMPFVAILVCYGSFPFKIQCILSDLHASTTVSFGEKNPRVIRQLPSAQLYLRHKMHSIFSLWSGVVVETVREQ